MEQVAHKQKYTNQCSRCGFRCLAETCPVGCDIYRVSKHTRCPGLSFEGDMAVCDVLNVLADWNIPGEDAKVTMGIGEGCCILARAIGKDGKVYNYADLSDETKRGIVRGLRAKR